VLVIIFSSWLFRQFNSA